jgi:tetratricopeptide (TPR) repeat protein
MPEHQKLTTATPQDQSAARQHNDFGTGFARQRRFEEAGAEFQQAIALDPSCSEAHNNLGNILREMGKIAEAAVCFQRAAHINPAFAMAYNNLGTALRELGHLKEAVVQHQRALALAPNYAEAQFNLGIVLADQGEFPAAADCYLKAIAIQPAYAAAHLNLGVVLENQGKMSEAEESYRRALTLVPIYVKAHGRLGNILMMQDRLDEAESCFRRALALRPEDTEVYVSIGNILARKCMHRDALESYQQAITRKPDHATARFNASTINLSLGNFAEGWPDYEWRWHMKNMEGARCPAMPLWDGRDLHGKSILLTCEQGLGDSLQFVRYAPMVKEKGGQVFLLCPLTLRRLFKNVQGIDQIYVEGDPAPTCDYRAPLLSLPLLLKTRLDTIPTGVPYLFAPEDRAAAWADRLSRYAGLKVGLVWAGDPRASNILASSVDRRRSIQLEQFAPLAKIPGPIHFFSLQKGTAAAQAKMPPPGLTLTDFMGEVRDFADTAAFVVNLDLVISVDTAVVHMAGALAKPIWVLSRFDGCWRWLLGCEDSPWYPTLRLFRQPAAGDWQSVVEKVGAALAHLTREHSCAEGAARSNSKHI